VVVMVGREKLQRRMSGLLGLRFVNGVAGVIGFKGDGKQHIAIFWL
jgi:hypothetical protein